MATQISNQFLTLADGNRMPQEGFGLYKITDEKEAVNAIKWAYETGYRLFDTAQMYENEEFVGEGLRQLSAPRESYFVTTKVSEANQGYDQTKQSVVSLKKLGLITLTCLTTGSSQHFFETWRAFEDLKAEGLVRSISVSNTAWCMEYLATKAAGMPVWINWSSSWLTENQCLSSMPNTTSLRRPGVHLAVASV